jgi:LmbE family N-acetylglucosaminyl deacetylase
MNYGKIIDSRWRSIVPIILYKKIENKTIKSNKLSEIFDNWESNDERWLFVSPHDDDIIIGSGILLQKAMEEKIKTSILITTDGSMGYCDEKDMKSIVDIRHKETLDSFSILGIKDVTWLNFPDSQLGLYVGKRKAEENDPCIIKGFTGLQNAYTYYFRLLKPTRIFLPSGTDLHVDHKITYQESLISIFHCNSLIWPELGEPLPEIPKLYEMAIYSDFIEKPDIKVESDQSNLELKLKGISAYKSQAKIIQSLVDKIKAGGPYEYFRDLKFSFYSPENYKDLFK